ncbi:MAG: uracil-DNA glycosylase family protein [Verrucomicrobiota bacterium]
MLLRDALDRAMKDWPEALPASWKPAFREVELASDKVAASLTHDEAKPIFPGIRPPRPETSSAIAHTFRAFHQVKPSAVRVVVVGQDPYPKPADATGQSFEQGILTDWIIDAKKVAKSLRPILRHAAVAATGRKVYQEKGGWARWLEDIASGALPIAPPNRIFEAWNRQGVMWINTTLTFTEFKQPVQKAHFAYWQPFINRFFEHVSTRRSQKPIIFVMWGGWAAGFRPKIEAFARDAGTLNRVHFAISCHPSAMKPSFLNEPNTLLEVNRILTEADESPIDWMPSS